MSSEPASGSRNPLLIEELFCAVLRCLVDTTPEPTLSPIDGPHRVGIPIRAPDPDTRRALATLARTCRAFTRPALDFLWCTLNSLDPLLRCYRSRETVVAMQPLRPPSPVDWDVIKRYACRIQYLGVQDGLSSFFLGCAMFETNLFPKLKVLKWNTQPYINFIDTKLVHPLLGPNLVVLDVTTHGDDTTFPSLLKALPSRCPAVTTARFSILRAGDLALLDNFSQVLCSFKNLKSLVLDASVNDHVLQHVLMFSQLQEICLAFQPRQLQNFSPSPSEIPLRNTRKLGLALPDLCQLIQLLRPGHQSFCSIMLCLLRIEFPAPIGSLFIGLAMQSQKSTLNLLHLHYTRPHLDLQDPALLSSLTLSFNTFQPLTCHSHLRELIILLPNPISLSDGELTDLARHWPLLQILDLSYFFRLPEGGKHMTFKGLLSLVSICPALCHVGLTLDGREVPNEVVDGSGSKTITTLRFPHSPISNQARLVATFLLTHFPSVTSVRGLLGANQLDRHGREWAGVEAYMLDPSKLGKHGRRVNSGYVSHGLV
ncbi:hypothetical protein JVT61DRAFT_8873 [Boletus reticuloceps]|uniref:F-box domain-containing protein n=1 Tax=Boletus reticuloceps TaxID=495285 RepID=A0A8I2YGQ0_9AGAM|nr:hypothetical protein JVT61DRAFT_8873 [Boletus reticuloceps]